MTQQDELKRQAALAAIDLVKDDMFVGLGTGTTAAEFVKLLAERVKQGLRISGAIPSSRATYTLAVNLGIPIVPLEIDRDFDLYIDGADEIYFDKISHQLWLLKGAGGAHTREKILAASAKRFVVIADESKLVDYLGQHFPVPVEVLPFAIAPVQKNLKSLGASVSVRTIGEKRKRRFATDNRGVILDCSFSNSITDPQGLHEEIKSIVGVVETGLFIDMAGQAFVAGPDRLTVLNARTKG